MELYHFTKRNETTSIAWLHTVEDMISFMASSHIFGRTGRFRNQQFNELKKEEKWCETRLLIILSSVKECYERLCHIWFTLQSIFSKL